MDLLVVLGLVALGVSAGIMSGLMGVGGGVLLIPALIYIFKFSQHEAQGTTLALMVLPIGLLAAATYYKNGNVDLKAAGLMAIGFFVGGLIGALLAGHISDRLLSKIFAVGIIGLGVKLLFFK